jgi:ribonucleoside-diphosphate reductase subunit M2
MSDSPAKKIDFSSEKENVFKPIVGIPDIVEDDESHIKPTVAPTIRPEEAHEPLLQENPGRFVLFPIKYHDVSLPYEPFYAFDACWHALNPDYKHPC